MYLSFLSFYGLIAHYFLVLNAIPLSGCTTVYLSIYLLMGFPWGSDRKESACSARELGSIPGSGGSPGEGNGNPLQYSCLENSMVRRTWLQSMGSQRVGHTYLFEHTL